MKVPRNPAERGPEHCPHSELRIFNPFLLAQLLSLERNEISLHIS